jgi:ferredoxin
LNINRIGGKIMKVDKDTCLGCGACVATCPVEAIELDADGKADINGDVCISCGACAGTCPVEAISED